MTYNNIADRFGNVKMKLGGRTDLNNNIYDWIGASYSEYAMAYDFEDLEETTTTSIDGNNSNNTYPYPTVTDNNNNDWEVRAVKNLIGKESENANNNRTLHLIWKPVKLFDRLPNSTGRPVIYTVYKKQVILHPAPSSDYEGWLLKWRVWLKPRFESGNNYANTEIFLPDDWLELVDYGAAMRGHASLLERDKAAEVMQLLYGSFDQRRGHRVPGLIEQKLLMRHAEAPFKDYAMRPKNRRYT